MRRNPNRLMQRRGVRKAVTLVEMLLALTIGSVVAATSATVAVQSLRCQTEADATIADRWARFEVGEVFAADVARILQKRDVSGLNISFPPQSGVLIELVTLAAEPNMTSPFSRLLPAKVSYLTKEAPGPMTTITLVRTVEFLSEQNGTALPTEIASGLRHVAVETYSDGGWRAPDPHARDRSESTRAVRIVCDYAEATQPDSVRTVVLPLSGREDN